MTLMRPPDDVEGDDKMRYRRAVSLLAAGFLGLGSLTTPAIAEVKRADLKVLGVT